MITFEQACEWLQKASLDEIYRALDSVKNPSLPRLKPMGQGRRMILIKDPELVPKFAPLHRLGPNDGFTCWECGVNLIGERSQTSETAAMPQPSPER